MRVSYVVVPELLRLEHKKVVALIDDNENRQQQESDVKSIKRR